MWLNQIVCTSLKGVGDKLSEKLKKCGILTAQDLLFHLPLHYQDRTRLTPIANARVGYHALIEGVITKSDIKFGKRRSLVCQLQDASGQMNLRFFYFNQSQQDALKPGKKLRCFGEVRRYSGLEMVHPECRYLEEDKLLPVEEHLTPIYPSTEGLSQTSFRMLIKQAIQLMQRGAMLKELIPKELLSDLALPDLTQAIQYIHEPPPDACVASLEEGTHPMQQRLAIEELIAHHLSLQKVKDQIQKNKALPCAKDEKFIPKFLSNLPFKLTNAQLRVSQEIAEDLTKPSPMLRLVQGDVGSGKTMVALLAILQAVSAGYQAVLMAPTELLAEQHYRNFENWLTPLGIELAWLTGQLKASERKKQYELIAANQAKVILGTHAVFQKEVQYATLGLIVIDEQHRFGVAQRMQLWEKGFADAYPHQLIMSATPIPRTMAMTVYADLDVSSIDELPPGRTPVTTVAVSQARRLEVIEKLKAAFKAQRQVYWVCTLIEESESLQCQAAENTFAQLKKQLPNMRIGLVHGRMKPDEKEQIMRDFKEGTIQLLVATTVIEVGVDVPNASVMIIENAERLGLAQLHQLRGRVGRGAIESHCVLIYQDPLGPHAKERLQIMRSESDGFLIAQRDLEMRGAGEVLGTRQAGVMRFKIADLARDKNLLPKAKQAAHILLKEAPDHATLLIQRWLNENEKFGVVG